MRGAHVVVIHVLGLCGIIPAYAGSTCYGYARFGVLWDHPRVCGEHCTVRREGPRVWGSSPRMRGAPVVALDGDGGVGIIPAYAGSTRGPLPVP